MSASYIWHFCLVDVVLFSVVNCIIFQLKEHVTIVLIPHHANCECVKIVVRTKEKANSLFNPLYEQATIETVVWHQCSTCCIGSPKLCWVITFWNKAYMLSINHEIINYYNGMYSLSSLPQDCFDTISYQEKNRCNSAKHSER